MIKIIQCDSYEQEIVEKQFNKLIDLKKFIKKKDKVLIKPNLLFAASPDKMITTHPSVIKAIVKQINKIGAKAIIADSPGGPYNKKALNNVYKKCGYDKIKNCTLNQDFSSYEIKNPKGFLKKYKLIGIHKKVDKVINVAKIKTHMLCTLSCATKNLFGLIPGGDKVSYHARFIDVNDFSKMLVEFALLTKPTLNIVDGIIGMEGEGPSNGVPKKVGVLIAGDNSFEVDYNVTKIISMDYKTVPYLNIAKEQKLFKENKKNYESIKVNFKKAHSSILRRIWNIAPSFLKNLLSNIWLKTPIVNKKTCIGCGECARSCPVDAIVIKNKKAKINQSKCVKCYCCHELCRFKSIDLKKKLF